MTESIAIITPSRGRPTQLAAMMDSVRLYSTLDVRFYIGLDDDDADSYESLAALDRDDTYVVKGPRRSLAEWTNALAFEALMSPFGYEYLASLGDDHRVRTYGWDRKLVDAIRNFGTGFAYGNDLYQGEVLPTAWLVSREIVSALGWMMLPVCKHMYVDSAVRDLGRAANRIAYLDDVVIEHLHPAIGKADWDELYWRNTDSRFEQDRIAYEKWLATRFLEDLTIVKAVR